MSKSQLACSFFFGSVNKSLLEFDIKALQSFGKGWNVCSQTLQWSLGCLICRSRDKTQESIRASSLLFTWSVTRRFIFSWIVIYNFFLSWVVIKDGKIFSCPREQMFLIKRDPWMKIWIKLDSWTFFFGVMNFRFENFRYCFERLWSGNTSLYGSLKVIN